MKQTARETNESEPAATLCFQSSKSYWSRSTRLTLYCFFSPSTADDVSTALHALASASPQFAVWRAGRMSVEATASIDQGVIIVMTRLKEMILTANGTIVSVSTSLTWWGCTSGSAYNSWWWVVDVMHQWEYHVTYSEVELVTSVGFTAEQSITLSATESLSRMGTFWT